MAFRQERLGGRARTRTAGSLFRDAGVDIAEVRRRLPGVEPYEVAVRPAPASGARRMGAVDGGDGDGRRGVGPPRPAGPRAGCHQVFSSTSWSTSGNGAAWAGSDSSGAISVRMHLAGSAVFHTRRLTCRYRRKTRRAGLATGTDLRRFRSTPAAQRHRRPPPPPNRNASFRTRHSPCTGTHRASAPAPPGWRPPAPAIGPRTASRPPPH